MTVSTSTAPPSNGKHDTLAAALAAAQGEFPEVPRSREVQVRMKSGGTYTFAYAPLADILRLTRPALARHGLAITQMIGSGTAPGQYTLTTEIMHAHGEKLSSVIALPPAMESGPQALGSVITYLRRYAVQSMLGIAAEEDDDGNAAEGNEATPAPRGPHTPPAASDKGKVTQKQIGMIRALIGERLPELRDDELARHSYFKSITGKERAADMTPADASRVIEALLKLPAPPPVEGDELDGSREPGSEG